MRITTQKPMFPKNRRSRSNCRTETSSPTSSDSFYRLSKRKENRAKLYRNLLASYPHNKSGASSASTFTRP
jgi:hypothetical protein